MTALERSQQRRTRLVAAAVELLGTRGAAETTVTAVCKQSGLTSRYFYEHFVDRDALLHAVFDDVVARVESELVAAIPAGVTNPGDLLRAPIGVLVQLVDEDRGLARILFVESGAEPTLRALRSDAMARMTNLLFDKAKVFLPIQDSLLPVAHLAATMAIGGIVDVLRRWLDEEIEMSAEQITEHTAGLFAGAAAYLVLGRGILGMTSP